MITSLGKFKMSMCVVFLILFQCAYGSSQETVSFENAKHLKDAYEKIGKLKKCVNYEKLVTLYLSKKTTVKEIEQSIAEFKDIIGILKESLEKNESFEVNIDDLRFDSELNFIEDGKTLSILLLLESRMYYKKEMYTDAIRDVFLVRKFSNNLSEYNLAIAFLVRVYIRNLSRILILDMVKKLPDKRSVLNIVILFNLENEKEVDNIRTVLLLKDKIIIERTMTHFFNTLRQKSERRIIKTLKEDNFSLYSFQLNEMSVGLEMKEDNLYDQINKRYMTFDFDLDELEDAFNQKMLKVFQETNNVISSDESYNTKKIELSEIVNSLEYDENKLIKALLSRDVGEIYNEYSNILAQFLVTPLVKKIYDYALMDQTMDDLLRLSIAINIYKRMKGEYPQSLINLKEVGFTKLPEDIFLGSSYRYRKESNGDFIVWSDGPDMEDDMAKEMYKDRKKKGDVFIGAFK